MEGDAEPVLLADVEQSSPAGDVEDKAGRHSLIVTDVTDKAEQEMLVGVAPLFDCGTSNLWSNS
jgi:hypothetical protein